MAVSYLKIGGGVFVYADNDVARHSDRVGGERAKEK